MTTVLLHGFTGDPRAWDRVAGALDGRVVRPLLPGHGARPRPVRPWGLEIDALAERLAAEGVERAHLVGYSFGGRLAWHLAARADLFARVTLIGAHPGLASEAEREARRAADRRWIERLRAAGLDAFVDAWEALPLWESQRELPESVLARQRAIRRSHNAAGLAEALERLGLAEMPPRPALRIPVQLVVGERDERHLALAEALDAPLARVPGAGHNVVLEAPTRLVELLR